MKTAALVLALVMLVASVAVFRWQAQAPSAHPAPTLPPPPAPRSPAETVALERQRLRQAEAALADLRARHAAALDELAAAQEAQVRAQAAKEVTFSYGTHRDSGRFVGATLRRSLEASLTTDPELARRLRAENRLDELSLGPFIREAEAIEADPERFAEFQGGLVSAMLDLEQRHEIEVEALLAAFKKESLRVDPGSPTWVLLDQNVRERIAALMTAEARLAKGEHLRFFEHYGMLIVPAYAALGER